MAMPTGEVTEAVPGIIAIYRCILHRYLAAVINTVMGLQNVKAAQGLDGVQKTA